MKAIITVGLSFGDEGKGTAVDFLSKRYNSPLVVRYNGGHQAAHNVVLPDGRHHTFSQFGSGTFNGAKTYLGRNVIVDPLSLNVEAQHLVDIKATDRTSVSYLIRDNIFINKSSLVTTIFNKYANRAWAEGTDMSCGVGIGDTREYWLKYGSDAIRADDLRDISVLMDKLNLQRQRYLLNADPVISNSIYHVDIGSLAKRMYKESLDINLVEYLPLDVLNPYDIDDVVIFEGSQGILLDEYYGSHPHTTWSTTTDQHAFEELRELDTIHNFDTKVIGITRTYQTRHGAGPLTCETIDIDNSHDHNLENNWQGAIRTGYMDIGILRYAFEINGGINALFVTHADKDPGKYYHSTPMDNNLNLEAWKTNPIDLRVNRPVLNYLKEAYNVSVISRGPTHKDKEVINEIYSS